MTETSNTNTIPAHQRPESCYVCGGEPHLDRPGLTGHNYWSNAAAQAEFAAMDASTTIPAGETPEARYVAEYIPEAVSG